MTFRAILSIVLFTGCYLLLIALSLALVAGCIAAGIGLIVMRPMFLTIMIGLGLVSMGVLVVIFVLKFMFKRHVTDKSGMIEISEKEEPGLWLFIREIVDEVHTDFPKRIFLSQDVNAFVFYDSSFWSLVMPVKKNLNIGIGLVNSVTEMEFKSILAHEFGHFSQRSMTVGSYVYYVNRVIFNMLYDNESYQSLAQRWGSINSYLTFFVRLAVYIVQGIQWLLQKLYAVVNLSYLSLSREMEFHADEVSASVAGSGPAISSLLRAEIASQSFQEVISFYNGKIADSVKPSNIYPQQRFVMNFEASRRNLEVKHGLPQIDPEEFARYNRSLLVIDNQWASHPGTDERVARIGRLNIDRGEDPGRDASTLFTNFTATQERLTALAFSEVSYEHPTIELGYKAFETEYTETFKKSEFSPLFNHYFDQRNVPLIALSDEPATHRTIGEASLLFTDEFRELQLQEQSLAGDIGTLKQIGTGTTHVRSFDYSGTRYRVSDCPGLIDTLEDSLENIRRRLSDHDAGICRYFESLAAETGELLHYREIYETFLAFDKEFDKEMERLSEMRAKTTFLSEHTSFDEIENKLTELSKTEVGYREALSRILENPMYQPHVDSRSKEAISDYLAKKLVYFTRPNYDNNALDILFNGMNRFQVILVNAYQGAKQSVLAEMERLESMR